MANDDYLSMMKILKENFGDERGTNVIREQYLYRQEHQKQEEDALRNAVIKKQKGQDEQMNSICPSKIESQYSTQKQK